MSDETVRWALSKANGKVVCSERTSSSWIEVHLRYHNLPLASQCCGTRDEAARWAERVRRAWEEFGWRATTVDA